MTYDIVPASDIAKSGSRNKGDVKYPWDKLQINQSFIIPCGEIQLISIQSGAYKAGKRLNKKFGVTDHGERGIEVTRFADPTEQENKTVGFVKQNGFPQTFDATKHGVGTLDNVKSSPWDIKNKIEPSKPVVDEPWKSPILDPRIDPSSVVKRVEVPVEPSKSEWKKERE